MRVDDQPGLWHIGTMLVEGPCPAEIIPPKAAVLGPRLRALLLAQPLNELVPLQFSELPSRRGAYGSAVESGSDNEPHQEAEAA